MPFVRLYDTFPDLLERETRSITVLDGPLAGVPSGKYAFLESYCNEPGCDCRRVVFFVITVPQGELQAAINYGWESREFYEAWLPWTSPETVDDLRGPSLVPEIQQPALAPAILEMARNRLLCDPQYVKRLKRHYRAFRETIDGKS